MRQIQCTACHAETPMNGAFSIVGSTLCQPCAEKFVSTRPVGSISKGDVQRLSDPTICVNCNLDQGTVELQTIVGAPMCDKCIAYFRNRPFPTWLKCSFAGFVCLAAIAFAYNWRFFMAYVEMIRGNHAMEKGRILEGVALLDSAAQRVPEVPELAVLPNLVKAQRLIAEEKDEEGLALLQKSRMHAPREWMPFFEQAELRANIGIAFNKRDYDRFLELSKQLATQVPDGPLPAGEVASAYACKFATTGKPEFKSESLKWLDQAKKLAGEESKEFKAYENRIKHRLATREIITHQEFEKRFPDGWKEQ